MGNRTKFFSTLKQWLWYKLFRNWEPVSTDDLNNAYNRKGAKCVFCDRKYND